MANDLQVTFVRTEDLPARPAPITVAGPIAWLRANLFSGVGNTIATLLGIYVLYLILPPLLNFLIFDAVWTGEDREACLESTVGRPVGACWAFVGDRLSYFIYGSYPIPERWRVDLTFVLGTVGIVWVLWLGAPRRDLGALYFLVIFPIIAFFLLVGSQTLGLAYVDTNLWGGILVSLVVATVGIVFSLPIGIALALGRRSKMPIVRMASVVFIEFVRGVPLITVLFMASTMLPLFVPEHYSPDKLLRALIGVALFASAYMAEVIRGGLQAIPKGQYEGAMSLGLGYGQMMRFIILPQALKIVIPGIVNTFIGLFKDTTLVFIVGIFDFLRTIQTSLVDPTWATPVSATTGYVFASIFYFVFCYGMSRYSLAIERRLETGHKR
jgi:general L-amino acid transport system permease protein